MRRPAQAWRTCASGTSPPPHFLHDVGDRCEAHFRQFRVGSEISGKCTAPRARCPAVIPPVAHFVWLGRSLPWVHALSPLSALRRGGVDRVKLWHEAALAGDPSFAALARAGVEPHVLATDALLEAAAGPPLVDLYRDTPSLAQRSDILRAAIIHAEGGVYVDMDAIVVRSLAPLASAGAYVG